MNRMGKALGAALFIVLGIKAAGAGAQEYLFSVPVMQMQVVVQPDASARVMYDITFRNRSAVQPIDVVDIGVPHANYSLSTFTASINGAGLTDIRPSQFVHPGVEIHLGDREIRDGRSGTLHVEFTMPDMVYQDTTRPDYASLRMTPTWFDGRFLVGATHLQIAVELPKSVQPDEVLDQGQPFSQKARTAQGALVGWDFPEARVDAPHTVGLSFPKRDLKRVVKVTTWGLFMKWFRESPRARLVVGLVFLALFGMLFFRLTGGTGVSVFVVFSALAGAVFLVSPGWELASLPITMVLIAVNEWYLHNRRPAYMPPIAQVEGGGIKRGLTAPEAAVLLEMPLARVLGLVIFGLLKKGLVRQVQAEPLVVEVDEAFRTMDRAFKSQDQRAAFYREAAAKKNVIVHPFEPAFLFLLESNSGRPVREIDFSLPMKGLIQRAAARMKGFDLRQTQDYYRSIVRRAVEQAKSVGDIQQREQAIDRDFEWILMDPGYPTVFTYGRPYRPIWTRGSTVSVPSAPSAPEPASPGKTTFGDVAASFAGWAESTMGGLATAISPAALSVGRPGGGFIDLSGADRITGAFFQALAEASASGRGGGSGGGGGCACACAGCACACACAGGGR